MLAITPNRRTLVKVEVPEAEKRRFPSKHYSYKIIVNWSDQSECVIYRRYSKFFEFQIILLETFPYEGGLKEPSARIIPFLPGKILFRRSHVRDVAIKRLKPIDEYCKALIKLPSHIAHCDHVLDFFEMKEEDRNPIRDDFSRKRRKDEQEIGEISAPLLLEPYVAIAEYTSTQRKELTIAVGQRVEVIEKNENGWWFVSNDEGERGWVPGVYLERPDGSVEDLVTKQAELGQGERYITTNAYTAENSDEISFGAGVIVEVLQKNLEGWWLVSYNGKQGHAPASYMEKSRNWTPNNKVEIISSIRDLKHRHSLPANTLSAIAYPSQKVMNLSSNSTTVSASMHTVSEEPVSPTPKKVVQPPPKRSSVKRVTRKRPDAPPPLPPLQSDEPTYDYMTIAPFSANIPDGVSFSEEKKVEVLEKSPGGWWFIKIGAEEGWAPASYIEKRENVKPKAVPPSRPRPPKLQKHNSSSTPSLSPVRKVPSVPNTANHTPIEKVTSMPTSVSQSSMSPAKRPLPPVPAALSSARTGDESDTYEEVGTSQAPGKSTAHSKPQATSKSRQLPVQNKTPQESHAGPVDFRSVLKSSIAAKQTEIKSQSAGPPARPTNKPIKNTDESKIKVEEAKSTFKATSGPQWPPGVKKTAVGTKTTNISGRLQTGRKTSLPGKTNEKQAAATAVTAGKATQQLKLGEAPPKLPPKPKSGGTPSSTKPGTRNGPPSSNGAVTDFRSVLRPTQKKQPKTSNGVDRSHSLNSDKKIPTKTKDQQNKPPLVPKKPANLPLKPPVPAKMKGFDEIPDGQERDSKMTTKKGISKKPPSKTGNKPVLQRFQVNNNSNTKAHEKKPVFTVGLAKIELNNPPDLSGTLTKRGSPDGQVDSKFADASKEKVPIIPPERKKKELKTLAKQEDSTDSAPQDTESKKNLSDLYIAISNYTGVEQSEISFSCSEKAEVLERAENNWWYVKIGDSTGWAPSSFFRPANEKDLSEKESYVSAGGTHLADRYYDSVYSEIEVHEPVTAFPANFIAAADFEAEHSSMVSLREGDRVRVTQEAEGGWWYAVLSNGAAEGWVPSSYLDPA